MVATTLRRGQVAVVGYNTGQTDGNGTTIDSLEFVILAPIGSGTIIRFTDRAWNGSAFVNAGSDGSFAFTAATDLVAGTVITITFSGGNASITVNGVTTVVSAGGFDLEQAGDAIYVYQGTDADTPTTFLSAIEIGDANTTFTGSLVNTGLVNGVTAVSTALDSATYHGPTTEAYAHFYNNEQLLENIMDSTNWVGDDADGQKALDQPSHNGPYNNAPNLSLWVAGQGGGNGLIHVGGDATVSSGQFGFNLTQLYTNLSNLVGGARDIVFDTVEGKFFVAEGERILQGNIADLLGNPSANVALTVLLTGVKPDGMVTQFGDNNIFNLELDTVNNIIYFSHGSQISKIVYNTAGQSPTVLADFNVGNPTAGSNRNHVDDFVIHFPSGTIYATSHRITSGQDGDQLFKNYIYKITGLDPADGTNAFTFANGLITFLPFAPDDDDATNGFTWAPGEAFPQEEGTLEGIAISPDGSTLYFTAATTLYDHDGDGGIGGGMGTAPQLRMGGVFSYALTGNPTGTYTQIWQQLDDGDTVSQAISHTFGPQGLLDDIEFDPVTGHLYFLDQTGDQLGAVNPPGDEGIWRIATNGTGLTYFANINNINAMGPSSIWLNHAPTVTSSTQATPGVTEASSAPSSGATALVQPFTALDVTDHESASHASQQLAGATVWISNNFQSGSTHQDTLTINGTQSGTVNGITYSYNAATGAMTLTGADTFADYETAIALVRFNTSGDDPTAYGTATNRTISWAVSDGLNHSDPVSTTISVTGINDAPVNTAGAAIGGIFEDTTGTAGNPTPPPVPRNAITGISVFDVDADPATQDIIVTLSVNFGTLTIRTDVTGGLAAGEVTGNGTATLVLTGTQNQINATLAAVNNVAGANGLVYTPPANFNGAATLTITTNDQGFNGNDPGVSGTGTTESDTDPKIINVTNVNDAPTVVDATQDATTILEDTPLAAGQTISSLFTASFDDALDQQQVPVTNPTGSVANTLGGIAIVAIDTSGTTGRWQYFNGTWTDIPGGSPSSAFLLPATTAIRFNPALNYNGPAPTLTAHLVDSSGGTIAANGETVNLSGVGATGGDTRYSTGTVVLSQAVTAVNDAPVNTVPGTLNLSEDAVNIVVAGLSVNDVEAGPAGQPLTVTLSVARGTLTISTAIAGGIDATHVSGGAPAASNQASITITATQAQINATLAGANGLTYTPTSNVNGNDTLTILTSDLGYTGTGGTLTDSDPRTLNVGAVNDAPTVGDGTESAVAINEDTPHTSGSAQTVSGLFGPQFSDATDQVAGGSTANGLLGIAIVVNGSNANGTWEWLNGAVWTAIGAASQAAAKTFDAGTQIRFNPATDFNGPAPTLTAHLVDNSSGTITNGGTVNLSAGGATGGTTRYSAGTVVLSQDVNSVNDAPTQSGLQGDLAAWTENGGPVGLDLGGNAAILDVDSADFGGGSLTVLLSSGVLAEDGLFIRAIGNITFDATTVSFNGTQFATYLGGGFGGGNIAFSFDTNASLAAVTALAQSLAYDNNGGAGEYPTGSTRSVTWTLVDGDGNLNGGNDTLLIGSQVSVTPINDSPVVTAATPLAVDEQVAEAIAPAGTLADADLDARNGGNGDYSGATLTIVRNGGANAQDLLTVVNGAGFVVNAGNLETSPGGLVFGTVSGGGASPLVITFTGSGTPATSALADAVLQAVQYVFTGDSPTSPFQLDLTLNDGAPGAGQGSVASNPASTTTSIMVNITDTAESVAPVIAGLNGDVVTSTEGVSPTVLIDDSAVAATVTDADSPHFNGGNLTVSITVNEVAGEDRLGIEPSATVTLSSGTDLGSVVSVGGNAIGTVTANGINGNDLVITFNTTDATPANVGLLVNAITYTNINAFDPSVLARTVSVTVNDSASTSAPATVTVNIVTQNDPPILDMDGPGGGATATLNYTENAPVTAIAPLAIRFDDTVNYDDGHLLISMTNGINGQDVLSIISTGTGPGQISYSSGVISYEGIAIADLLPFPMPPYPVLDIDFRSVTISAAAVEALMRAIGYNNTSDNPTVSPARSVTYSLNDGEGNANGGGHTGTGSATINITATNDAATITGTITGSVTEAGGINNGTAGTPTASADLGATDPDNTADAWQVIAAGTVTATGYGSYGVDAAGVWTYTLNDNNASVQALAGAATLTDTFSALTEDGTSQLITITINAQDDGPTAQPDAFTITEAGSIVGGNVFANNGSGPDSDPDGPPLSVSAVSGGTVGVQFMLPSGALLTMNANGTFNYNTNNAFDTTPTAGSGASNTPAPDSFTYTLTGGGTTTVSLTITGLDTNDFLFGTGGTDSLTGGIGDDFYFVEQAADTVNEIAGQGFDVIWTTVSYILAAGTDVEALSTRFWEGTGAINLTGNGIANNIYGNAGANTLDGMGGNDVLFGFGGNDSLNGGTGTDVMHGGAGDDFYFIDVSGDTLIETAAQGYDVAWTTASYVLAAGIEVEVLSARFWEDTTAIDLAGNALDNVLVGNNGVNNLSGMGGNDILDGMGGNDTLLGGAGNDRLQGGTGADAMFGGANDDFYFVDNSGDSATESAAQGFDVVWTSVSYALAAGSEIEALSAISWEATTALTLVGNDLGNALYGNAGANILNGRGGNDTLVGFGGADSFLFDSALGGNVDTIADFSSIDDTIVLDDSVFAALSTGTLNANAFVIGTAALDADDRIIYDSATGALYYDADGSGAGLAVQFAILQGAPPINSSDFQVI